MHFLRLWHKILWSGILSVFLDSSQLNGKVIKTEDRANLLHDYGYHEEIVPDLYHGHHKITSTKLLNGHLGAIILNFSSHNVTFVADLHLNIELFSDRYQEKYFVDGEPVINTTTNHIDSHCYYHGRLRGEEDSVVAISTCQGISGSIFSRHGVYHIAPVQPDIKGPHLVFNNKYLTTQEVHCGHGDKASSDFHGLKIHNRKHHRLKRASVKDWPYDTTAKTRVVEMYIVNDKTEYDEHKTDVIDRTKTIINLVSSLYRPIDVYVALVGIEVWNDKDHIDVVENPDTTMNNFLEYRREHITVDHPNDNAQLITGRTLGSGVVGKAPIMTICSWQYSGGVNMDHNRLEGPVATTVAHELGHNFGLSHDTDTCGCPDDRCIMAASSGGINNPTKWSECSKQQFADAFEQGMDYCLKNLPSETFLPSCGNGLLEDGEECDCGLQENCNTLCCDALTCRLTENATCATGQCCNLDNCQLKPAATVCRPAQGPCDLPETCLGTSEHCPENTYLADGTPCEQGEVISHCYHGECRSHESQCQLLWGRTGHNSHPECYRHYNVMGQANGHCGFKWVNKNFLRCSPQDVLCGMLHCTHLNEKLMFWKEALTYTMPEGSVFYNNQRYECKSAILDVGLDMPDPGMVPDGAPCGTDKMCVAQKCINVADLDIMPCPDCNGHGVCNNFGECHCDASYAPPFCKNPGNGGSLRSGPITVSNDKVSLIIGLCVFFFIIVPLLVLAGIYGYRHRDNLKKIILHGPTEGYRSIYLSKPRNDIVNHVDKGGRVAMVATNISSASANNCHNASPTSSVTTSNNRPEVKRAASFRPQDISRPQLESSTKALSGIPTLRHSIGAVICTGGEQLPTTSSCGPVPHRPAPAPPVTTTSNRWSTNITNATSIDATGTKPHRPPPPKENTNFKKQRHLPVSPKANDPLPPTPERRNRSWNQNAPTEQSLQSEPHEDNNQAPPEYPAAGYPAVYPTQYNTGQPSADCPQYTRMQSSKPITPTNRTLNHSHASTHTSNSGTNHSKKASPRYEANGTKLDSPTVDGVPSKPSSNKGIKPPVGKKPVQNKHINKNYSSVC